MPESNSHEGVELPRGCWLAGTVLQSMRIKRALKIIRKLPIVKGLSKISFFMTDEVGRTDCHFCLGAERSRSGSWSDRIRKWLASLELPNFLHTMVYLKT